MLYMLRLQIYPGLRTKAVEEFESRGPNRTPGVKFRGAWVATKEDVAFSLIDAPDEEAVERACAAYGEYGTWSSCPVIDIEDY